ncbi:MAG TPA: aminoacyl-tRNA hydrolase [Myxococcota bacterium]|jgi:PTH1 family peptidyl-tRNA hydrolase|nr:aminoacyl-tRNA hydrolase [Myxococcota bacterium]
MVVGLGNPGPEYRDHRHNVGFMVAERFAAQARIALGRQKFKAEYGDAEYQGLQVAVLLPQTWMNLSGESVGRAAAFWKVPPERVLVVHDDIDLELGVVRVKRDGGHGGHNGLRSLHDALQGGAYPRVRVGVGRPVHGTVEDYVLQPFRADERVELEEVLEQAVEAVKAVLSMGAERASSRFPRKRTAVPRSGS